MMKFPKFHEHSEWKLLDLEIYIWAAPMKEISRVNYKRIDLLYETVYRRLDMILVDIFMFLVIF